MRPALALALIPALLGLAGRLDLEAAEATDQVVAERDAQITAIALAHREAP